LRKDEATFAAVKSDGTYEQLSISNITAFVRRFCYDLDHNFVDPDVVAKKVMQGLYDGVKMFDYHSLVEETAAYMSIEHPDYTKLAARMFMSHMHDNTPGTFLGAMRGIQSSADPTTGVPEVGGFLDPSLLAFWEEHGAAIEAAIDYSRDFDFDYFGIKTLERSYLLRAGGLVAERPQHLWMRVALGIHGRDLAAAFETYDLMSQKWFVHASPTLFHAGTRHPQLSSCFLLAMQSDSIGGIYGTLARCAAISKAAGGIGLSVSKIRGTGSLIRGTKGVSNGLVPMLRVFDATARYVDQGGGKRPGAFAVYLEPWHPDIFDVLDLRKNTGKAEVGTVGAGSPHDSSSDREALSLTRPYFASFADDLLPFP
jgi:ribonucleoside-diphosphate reductase alpha chain